MIKARLLAGMIAVMSLGAVTAPSFSEGTVSGERDSRIIVELSRGLDGLTDAQIASSQKNMLNRIRSNVSSNVELVQSYNVLNNAFVIECNSADIEAIRSLPGVESVTLDKLHARKTTGETYSASFVKPADAVEENISATTMHKPSNTNDGEGTVIAVLDNEFFFRGQHTHKPGEECSFEKYGCTEGPIFHEVYTELDSSVAVKYTYDNLTSILKTTKARRRSGTTAGQEGSLYFNSKVPFYYDYGGESKSYGKEGPMDYDVSSIISYHGSHVATISAGNAPTYKGIAPKAQLACMKVFTNYKADDTATNLGFGDSSGAYDSCILAALEDAILLGVDGINMSLGSDLDDFDQDGLSMKTLNRLATGDATHHSILTAISAGNAGKESYSFTGAYGNWTRDMVETGILGSYANAKDAMTVASGQPTKVYYENAIKLDGANVAYEDQIVNREGLPEEFSEEFKLVDIVAPGGSVEWQYIPGFGTGADYGSLDVEGKVAVVNRGSTAFADKYAIAKDKGAIALIIINNDPTASDFNFRCSFGDDFMPSMPCALALFRDKITFEQKNHGTFTFISKETAENANAYTMSTFSSDGAQYDFNLKPEITAPGDIIKGAVPPQKKEDKEHTPLSTYEYLSGTSMSAPNYAGAQSVVLSKVTKDVYSKAAADITAEDIQKIDDFRETVDMRLMSTADPMYDKLENPETGELVYTSPRLQGAGMVDLDGAYNTDVYLEGNDAGRKIKKSKICLYNNEDIANGKVSLSFTAHNEGTETRNYTVKMKVMRPAVIEDNKIVKRNYNFRSEVDDIKYLPGLRYYDTNLEKMVSTSGYASHNDVFKLTKQIEYYPSEESYLAGEPVIMEQGNWYVTNQGSKISSGIIYEELPSDLYQSIQDIVIAEITGEIVTVAPGESTIKIDDYNLTDEEKAEIKEYYPYGCAIEGFVELISNDESVYPSLNIPYLGFYSLADLTNGQTYKDAPIAEPFSFEKDPNEVYPSYLVNDVAKSLLGKDLVNFESLWVTGYIDNPENVNTDKILVNDAALDKLAGFHTVGLDPQTGKMNDDGKIYVGNPYESNTMLIQQFIMRSVNDNFFTIKNKSTGETVYKSVLEDLLFGDQYGRYPLYKSHVDGNYLSAGYVGHRAYAAIPLYDTLTGEAYPDGEYEIEFNYQLLGYNNEWVKKAYTFVVDATQPEFVGISKAKVYGEDGVRFEFKDCKMSYGTVGYQLMDFQYDSEKGVYYMEMTNEELNSAIADIGPTTLSEKRLFVQGVDKAYGVTGVVIHFTDASDITKIEAISGKDLSVTHDFSHSADKLKLISIDSTGAETDVTMSGLKTIGFELKPVDPPKPVPQNNNNLGLILGLSIGGGVLAVAAVTLIILSKKKIIFVKK